MGFGRVRHSRKKVAIATRRETGYAMRTINVRIQVRRATEIIAAGRSISGRRLGNYIAEACVTGKGKYRKRCEHGDGTSPTGAIKQAISSLARGLK